MYNKIVSRTNDVDESSATTFETVVDVVKAMNYSVLCLRRQEGLHEEGFGQTGREQLSQWTTYIGK